MLGLTMGISKSSFFQQRAFSNMEVHRKDSIYKMDTNKYQNGSIVDEGSLNEHDHSASRL